MSQLIKELRTKVADEAEALDLLEVLFDAYEDGPPCYEDPDEQSGFLGNAVRLDDAGLTAAAHATPPHPPHRSTWRQRSQQRSLRSTMSPSTPA
jgi:hypothetical protein